MNSVINPDHTSEIPSDECQGLPITPSSHFVNFLDFSESSRRERINPLSQATERQKEGNFMTLKMDSKVESNKFKIPQTKGSQRTLMSLRNSRRKSVFKTNQDLNQLEKKNAKRNYSTNIIRVVGRLYQILGKIRKKLELSRLENLNLFQLSIINDYTYSNEIKIELMKQREFANKKRTSLLSIAFRIAKTLHGFNILIKLVEERWKSIPVFLPKSKFRLFWSSLLFIFIIMETFLITIQLFFDHSIGLLNQKAIDNLPANIEFAGLILFSLDILFNFNTGFYMSGGIILDRIEISKKYLRKFFIHDIIAIAIIIGCWIYGWDFSHIPENEHLCGLSLSWVFGLKNLEEVYFHDEKYENLFSLIKLFLEMLIVAHLIACMWNFVADYRDPLNWRNTIPGLNKMTNWNIKYTYSLYWSFSTVVTVGYGDISPKNDLETALSIVAISFGCMFFAYAINSIGTLVVENNRKFKMLRSELRTINNMMKRNNVELGLRIKVRKYLEHVHYEEAAREAEKESNILNKLSHSLKREVLIQMNGRVLNKIPFFTENFSEEALERIAQVMKTIRFAPGDDIFFEGDENNGDLYFVIEGEVECYLNCFRRNGDYVKLRTVKPLDYFGLETFFTNESMKFSSKSNHFSTLLILNREDFISTLSKTSKKDKETFYVIRDNVMLYKMRPDVQQVCESCQESSHKTNNCPLLQYKPDSDMILRRYLFSQPQERLFWKRDNKKTIHALLGSSFNDSINRSKDLKVIHSIGSYQSETSNENNEDSDLGKVEDHHKKRDFFGSWDEGLIEDDKFFTNSLSHNDGDQQSNKSLRKALTKKESMSTKKRQSTSTKKSYKKEYEQRISSQTFTRGNENCSGEQISEPTLQTKVRFSKRNHNETSISNGQNLVYLFLPEFDRLCNFFFYFPENNACNVIEYFSKKKKKNNKIKSESPLIKHNLKISAGSMTEHLEQKKFFLRRQRNSKQPLMVMKSPTKRRNENIFLK